MTTPTQTGDKPMVTPELLPCPFCGGDEFLILSNTLIGEHSFWGVECGCHVFGPTATLRAEAIAAWNTRAQETLSPEHPRLGREEMLERYLRRARRVIGERPSKIADDIDAYFANSPTPPASPEASPSLGMGDIQDFTAEHDDETYTIHFPDGYALTAWSDGRLVITKVDKHFKPFAVNVAALSPSPDLAEEND